MPPSRVAADRLNDLLRHRAVKPAVFVLALVPLALLLVRLGLDRLGPEPAEVIEHATGLWALRLLLVTLAVTPLRVLTGLGAMMRLRRMLGLFAFFYALLHVLAYAGFDKGFALAAIARDIGKRPFIFAGFAAFVLLVPLAATSFDRAIRALGGRRWLALHRTVYAVLLLVLLHFAWLAWPKLGLRPVAPYLALAALLLGWRVWNTWRTPRRPSVS